MSNVLGPDQDRQNVDPGGNCLQKLSAETNVATSKERVNAMKTYIKLFKGDSNPDDCYV